MPTPHHPQSPAPGMIPSLRAATWALVIGTAAGWAAGHHLPDPAPLAPAPAHREPPHSSPRAETPQDPKLAPAAPSALEGPRVGAKHGQAPAPTLVVQEFNGTIQRVPTTPEEAALDLIPLSPADRKAADAVFARRASQLEKFVSEHLTLLIEIDTAQKSGDTDDFNRTLVRAVLEMWPILSQGSLRSQISRVLPRDARHELDRLLNEYWNAIASERAVSNLGEAIAMRVDEWGKVLGKEIEAAYQRAERSGYVIVGFLTSDLDMTDETRTNLRRMAEEFAETHGENATEAQKATLVFQMALMLEGDSRAKFIQRVRALTGN